LFGGSTDVLKIDADYFKMGITSSSTRIIDVNLNSNSDYRSDITKMLSQDPDSFTLIMALADGSRFLKQFNELKGNKKVDLICDVNTEFAISDYIKAVGTSTFEGCISTNLPNTTSEKFKVEYKNKYGAEPMIGADWIYDAVTIVKGLVDTPRVDWLSKIQSTSLDGVSGKVVFDQTGTRIAASEDRIFKNGKFVKLEE
jgi:ABC-type branched-subunit amino acid transport system substrate-binding protein